MQKYFEPLVIFSLAILGSMLLLVAWSYVFTGDALRVHFQDELPNALILSAAFSSFVLILRKTVVGRGKTLLLLGFVLISFEVFMELPLKKLVAVQPALAPDITRWFFLFGLIEFMGMMLVLLGFAFLLKKSVGKP